MKETKGKLRWDLLPLDAVEGAVEIFTFGATKYPENSWKKTEGGIEKYYAAMMRHLMRWRTGEDTDEESGYHHLKHVLINVIFLVYRVCVKGEKNG